MGRGNRLEWLSGLYFDIVAMGRRNWSALEFAGNFLRSGRLILKLCESIRLFGLIGILQAKKCFQFRQLTSFSWGRALTAKSFYATRAQVSFNRVGIAPRVAAAKKTRGPLGTRLNEGKELVVVEVAQTE